MSAGAVGRGPRCQEHAPSRWKVPDALRPGLRTPALGCDALGRSLGSLPLPGPFVLLLAPEAEISTCGESTMSPVGWARPPPFTVNSVPSQVLLTARPGYRQACSRCATRQGRPHAPSVRRAFFTPRRHRCWVPRSEAAGRAAAASSVCRLRFEDISNPSKARRDST